MKKTDVKVGKCYAAKVSGKMATVRIDAENLRGGWDATNLRTNQKIRIRSPQRLRHETRAPGAPKSGIPKAVDATKRGNPAGSVTVPTGAKKTKKATKDAKDAARRDTGERDAKEAKRTSGLDAAAKVLADAKQPLDTKAMVERMLAKGLWKTSGKTPAATIYAAIIREIAAKGKDARFRKAERGKFELAH